MNIRHFSAIAVTTIFLFCSSAVQAATFGSTLPGPANVAFGCEAAPVVDQFSGGITITPSFQTTCTWRHVGYLNSLRPTSQVPGNGSITRVRVRAGANPAPLRVTILSGSSQIGASPDGEEPNNTFSCCSARRFGPVFQPRPNATTTVRMNIPVRSRVDSNRLKTTDIIALSAVGPGTLPVRDTGLGGTFADGVPIAAFWYPLTGIGDPRVDAYSITGYELLFQWTFKRR